MELLKRSDAQKAGVGQYFTGKKCKHGHLANRYTQSGACVTCVAVSAAQKRGTEHCGVVVTRAQREAERVAKTQAFQAELKALLDARRELVEIKLAAYTTDHRDIIFDTAVQITIVRFPILTKDDVIPDRAPLRDRPVYKVRVHPDDVALMRGIDTALGRTVPFDGAAFRAHVIREVDKMANAAASEPPETFK